MVTVLDEALHGSATDVAGASGDENPHMPSKPGETLCSYPKIRYMEIDLADFVKSFALASPIKHIQLRPMPESMLQSPLTKRKGLIVVPSKPSFWSRP
jgi:hypothetical protein